MLRRIKKWFVKKFRKPLNSFEPVFVANTTPSEYDSRDYLAEAGPEFDSSISLNPRPPIRNQGSIGSCASFASLRALEYQFLAQDRFLELSELYHYYNARKKVNGTYPVLSGMNIRDACKTSHKFGNAPELTWQYDVDKANVRPGLAAYWLSNIFELERYERLTTHAQIVDSLKNGYPVMCGIFLDPGYYSLKTALWTPDFEATGSRKYGAHAVLIVGWKQTPGVYEFDNSWGTDWGAEGRFYMRRADFERVSFDWFRLVAKNRF